MNATVKTENRSHRAAGAILLLAALLSPSAASARQRPVLMVIASQDFYYQEYAAVRAELAKRGHQVVVASASTAPAIPQASGRPRIVVPDIAVTEASPEDYSAIVFVGGWGASSYQYAFEGTYDNSAYQPDPMVAAAVNNLINDFIAQDKPVAALSHAVSVLAWARVDGVSPLQGRTVSVWPGAGPAFKYDGQENEEQATGGVIQVYFHVIRAGARYPPSASLGDPLTSADDVIVDGRIITAENYDAAPLFASALAQSIGRRK